MSRSGFPIFAGQPLLKIENFAITGASVGATLGTAGLDGRGVQFCTISLTATNLYTVVFNVSVVDTPYVFFNPLTANCAADSFTLTQNSAGLYTGFTFNSVTRDAHGTPIAQSNWQIAVFEYNTTSVFS